jgi:hypothetical protein
MGLPDYTFNNNRRRLRGRFKVALIPPFVSGLVRQEEYPCLARPT